MHEVKQLYEDGDFVIFTQETPVFRSREKRYFCGKIVCVNSDYVRDALSGKYVPHYNISDGVRSLGTIRYNVKQTDIIKTVKL